jgi:hypothetical protein
MRVKVGIRDLWSKDDTEVQKAIAEVKQLIGHEVSIEPEWQLLWAELQKHYEDNSRFVPDVVQVVVTWCRSLCEMAEEESNEEWTETMLEKLKAAHVLKVLLDVNLAALDLSYTADSAYRSRMTDHRLHGQKSRVPSRYASQRKLPSINRDCSLVSMRNCVKHSRRQSQDHCPNAQQLPAKIWKTASQK